jgi:glycosyltransferase involved in cell wall biosynthesis
VNPELKLSVVVSCYNQQQYIADCLKSILQQQVNFDYEVIIADDCSSDKTREIILETVEQNFVKIKLLFNEINLGPAKNYFSAHNQAQGKYVAHIDGDDMMLPGKLQAQVDVMENTMDCNIVFHRSRYFSDDRNYLADTGSLFEDGKTVFISSEQLARWGTIAAHGTYMYRRSVRKTHEYARDFMEWYFAFETIANGGVAAYINTIYLEYRCNPTSHAYLASKAGREKSYLIIIQHVVDYFNEYPEFRSDLYSQQLINVAMYIKNIQKIKWSMVSFLLKHSLLFKFSAFKETVRVRKMVGPSRKIR